MSLSKRLMMAVGLLALGTSTVWADCSRRAASTVRLDMAMGRVVTGSAGRCGYREAGLDHAGGKWRQLLLYQQQHF